MTTYLQILGVIVATAGAALICSLCAYVVGTIIKEWGEE